MGEERTLVGERVYLVLRKRYYYADYHLDGQHRRKSLRTTNKKEARRRAVELDRRIADGSELATLAVRQRTTERGISLNEAASRYREYLTTERMARKSIVKYLGVLDVLTQFMTDRSSDRIDQFTIADFDAYRAHRSRTLAPATMSFEGNFLKQFFEWARQRGLVKANPLEGQTFAKHKRVGRKLIPSRDEVRQVLDACRTDRRLHLGFLAMTGLRSGEMQHLRPQDVDLDGGWIYVTSREDWQTKTHESRKVPVHRELRRLFAGHKPGRDWYFTAESSNRYPDGQHHMNPKKLNERLVKMLKRMGLPAGREDGYTVHSLRHFFRTFTTNAGVPERMVNMWVGHAADDSMGTVYYNPSDEEFERFMTRIEFGLID